MIFPDDWKEKLDDGRYRLTVRRALDTGDIFEDYVIPVDQEIDIGFAYNTYYNAMSPYSMHNFANSTSVTLTSDGSPAWGSLVDTEISADKETQEEEEVEVEEVEEEEETVDG